jgi:hypothetical protein
MLHVVSPAWAKLKIKIFIEKFKTRPVYDAKANTGNTGMSPLILTSAPE